MITIEKIFRPDRATIEALLSALETRFDKNIYAFLKRPGAAYFKQRALKKFVADPDCMIYVAREAAAPVGVIFFSFLQWDTSIFGFKMGRIDNIFINMADPVVRHDFLKGFIDVIRNDGYRHVNCRLGIKDYGSLHALEFMGFNLVDIQLTLSTPKDFIISKAVSDQFTVRAAVNSDLHSMAETVKGGFTDTRFVNDKKFPIDGVDRMYAEWVKNSLSNPDKRIFVAEEKGSGKVCGFIIGGIDADSEECLGQKIGFFELAAISKECRNRGIFQALIRHFVGWFKEKEMDRVEARTQISNIAALKALMHGGLSEICENPTQVHGVTMHGWF